MFTIQMIFYWILYFQTGNPVYWKGYQVMFNACVQGPKLQAPFIQLPAMGCPVLPKVTVKDLGLNL